MPRDRQAYQGTESSAGIVLQMLSLQGELVELLGQGLEGLLPLQPGQGGAQAVMDARPAGRMGVRIAGNVKRSGSGNTLGSRLAAKMNHRSRSF